MPMQQKRPTRPLAGIVLVDKPQGFTSNRILQQVKRLFQANKAGHTGTLDPMATGMLPVCFGAATKVSGWLLNSRKRYRVTAEFGVATDTGDATGIETERHGPAELAIDDLKKAVESMTGRIRQVPPMYSALKHEGRRLYKLAREGKEVPREPREVEIFDLTIEAVEWPRVTLEVNCSKGTYVRTLVTDIASALQSVAHVTALRRLSVEPFEESQMVTMETIESAAAQGLESLDRLLLTPDAALVDRPAINVDEPQCEALRHGRSVSLDTADSLGSVRIYDPQGRFVGLGDLDSSGMIRPERIFPA